MIVTIDGPAGAGKSSVARRLAKRLGFRFLDTGSMYRAVVFTAIERGVSLDSVSALAELTGQIAIEVEDDVTHVDGKDVSKEIRTGRITQLVFHAADNVRVRELLSARQREIARGKNVVTEGRDQGTVVFPDAECKIFLTASAEERALRRMADMKSRGEEIEFEEVLRRQNYRDEQDYNRGVGKLQKADDAIELSTDGMSTEEVLSKLEQIVARCRAT
jgi:cytidylate kinase/pantoate ligase/cytidylate kinase